MTTSEKRRRCQSSASAITSSRWFPKATTLEGYLARVRVIMLENLELDPAFDAQSRFFSEAFIGALLRDVVEQAGVRRPT
jgi:hypothetical protein